MPATLQNGSNVPLNFQQGTVPNMMEALTDYMQVLSFEQVTKTPTAFELVETIVTTTFSGLFMPYSPRELALIPAGQRAWSWYHLFTLLPLTLQVDDVVVFPQLNNKQTRVIYRNDFALYSYLEYKLVQDWTGSGPPTS